MDELWMDLTVVGSAYEVQMDINSDPPKFRHRRQSFTEVHAEWRPGKPHPSGCACDYCTDRGEMGA